MSRLFSKLIVALTLGAFCTCPCAMAQDDPFGNVGGGSQSTGNTTEDAGADTKVDSERPDLETLDPSVRLIVKSVRNSNPATASQLAAAVQTMMDIEEYREARFYLKQLNALNLDESGFFKLNQSMGSDFFLRLLRSQPLAPEGSQFANMALRGAKKTATDPKRIDQLIEKLGDQNSAIRSGAARELMRLGEPAVAQMINVFADDSRASQFDSIRAALQIAEKLD